MCFQIHTFRIRNSLRHGFEYKLLAYWLMDSNADIALLTLNSLCWHTEFFRTKAVSGIKNLRSWRTLHSNSLRLPEIRKKIYYKNGKIIISLVVCCYLRVFCALPISQGFLQSPYIATSFSIFPAIIPTKYLEALHPTLCLFALCRLVSAAE